MFSFPEYYVPPPIVINKLTVAGPQKSLNYVKKITFPQITISLLSYTQFGVIEVFCNNRILKPPSPIHSHKQTAWNDNLECILHTTKEETVGTFPNIP